MDQIVDNNIEGTNDASLSELKATSIINRVKEPTPVTLFHLLKNNKNKKKRTECKIQKGQVVLLDSGSSHSLITKSLVNNLRWKRLRKPIGFESCNGSFDLEYQVEIDFILSELNNHRSITWQCYVDDREADDIGYDMIIGRDMMTELGITLDFHNKKIVWADAECEMRDFTKKLTPSEIKSTIQQAVEPVVTKSATSRLTKILDATYEKADLQEVVSQAHHINKQQKQMLYNLLKKYEEVFDGQLSQWDTEPVEFEFIKDAKPHSQRLFPVPHIHKETFKKELLRLVKIGVLEVVRESEWGSPTFIIPKKDGKVRFISDFRKLNAKLKRKPYPLPRIAELLQDLSGFTHATVWI